MKNLYIIKQENNGSTGIIFTDAIEAQKCAEFHNMSNPKQFYYVESLRRHRIMRHKSVI